MSIASLDFAETWGAAGAPAASRDALRLEPPPWLRRAVAAVHVGADDVACKIVRPLPGGGHETLHAERAPLLRADDATIECREEELGDLFERYGRACWRHGALARATFGRAFRRREGASDVIARLRRQSAIEIEALSEREEARLLCRGVFAERTSADGSLADGSFADGSLADSSSAGSSPAGSASADSSIVIAMDGEMVTVVLAAGGEPAALWDLGLQRVRLREIARAELPRGADIAGARVREEIRGIVSSTFWRVVPRHAGRAIAVGGAARLVRGVVLRAGHELLASEMRETNAALTTHWLRESLSPGGGGEVDRLLFRALMLEGLVDYLGVQRLAASEGGPLEGLLRDAQDARATEVAALS
jgi:hypothetical protein